MIRKMKFTYAVIALMLSALGAALQADHTSYSFDISVTPAIAVPAVSGLSAYTGSNLAPVTITVTGSNFFAGLSTSTVTEVKLGSTVLAGYTAVNESTITGVIIPAGLTIGTYDVTVTALGGTSVTSSADRFTVTTSAPTVSSLSVSTGSNLNPVTISVNGTGFFGGVNANTVTSVKLGTLTLTAGAVPNDSTITGVIIPAGRMVGTFDITVAAMGGTSATSVTDQFVVTTPLPAVGGLSASSGSNLAPATIVVSGTGFFGGVNANTVTSVKLGTLTLTAGAATNDSTLPGVIIPSGLAIGTYDVTVTALGGASLPVAQDVFAVTTDLPVVSVITPASGSKLANITVSIGGTGFFAGAGSSAVTAVSLGATPITDYYVISSSLITGAVIPAGLATGTYDIQVATIAGTSVTNSGDEFVAVDKAVVTGIAPSAGSNLSSVTVTATGASFFGGGASSTVTAVNLGA